MNNYIYALKSYNLYKCLETAKNDGREVVFLCVGNSKIWYDSFGPMIGSLLKHLNINKFVYGNCGYNITAKNLDEYLNLIYKFHVNPFIIVVDSCFSSRSCGLKVSLSPSLVAGFTDKSRRVGDLSINYCVNKDEIKDSKNYMKMLRSIKSVALFIDFVF